MHSLQRNAVRKLRNYIRIDFTVYQAVNYAIMKPVKDMDKILK